MNRFLKILPIVLLSLLLFSVYGLADELSVHFIDVGQGDAILIQAPCNSVVLIDGGDRFTYVREALVAYIRGLNIETIDAVVGTHPHADHIGGLSAVLENFEVKRVYDSGRVHPTLTYLNYLELIEELDIPFYTPRRGEVIEVGELVFTVLHPYGDVEDYSVNDASIVLRLEYGEVSFLFTGDAEERAEREIVSSGLPVEATILKVGHHGSSSSSTEPFLDEVKPEVALIQVGADNRYGHPHDEVLRTLGDREIEIYRNDYHGNIVVNTDGKNYWIEVDKDVQVRAPPEEDKININTASSEELQELPGIGPVIAGRIVEYREEHGPFQAIEEIKNVSGIGEARFEGIKGLITVGDNL